MKAVLSLVPALAAMWCANPAAVHGACPWDCQASPGAPDGIVDIRDLLDLLSQWSLTGTTCDLGLGEPGVGVDEFIDVLAHWGLCPLAGACCTPQRACTQIAPGDCDAAGGEYLGNGTSCETGSCALGACCLGDGACVDEPPEAGCVAMGGLYQGDGSDCGTATCPGPFGACCIGDDRCLDDIGMSMCALLAGTFRGPGSSCAFLSCGLYTGACCLDGACAGLMLQEECDALGGQYLGDETTCSPGACAQGACCIDETCMDAMSPDHCAMLDGVYFGDGSLCELQVCGTPAGACCYGESCAPFQSQDECVRQGGSYLGNTSTCHDPSTCIGPPPTGACCLGTSCVATLTEQGCLRAGGAYQGDDASCEPGPCPEPTGACCLDGSCSTATSQLECEAGGGAYLGDGSTCPGRFCVPLPSGACCLSAEDCSIMTQDDCDDEGGVYQGDASICDQGVAACPAAPAGTPVIKDDTTRALDPKLTGSPGASIVTHVQEAGNWAVTIDILDGATVIKNVVPNVNRAGQQDFTDNWDGTKADGSFAPPKEYKVRISVAGGGEKSKAVHVVRVGVSKLIFGDSSNAAAAKLQWHHKTQEDRANVVLNFHWALKQLDADAAPFANRPEPPPHDDFPHQGDGDDATNADQFNYPCAYPRRTQDTPRHLKIAASTAPEKKGFTIPTGAPEIRISSSFNGTTVHDGIKAATDYAFESDPNVLSADVARTVQAHEFTFFYKHAAGDFRAMGKQATSHIIYTTFKPSIAPPGGQPYPARHFVFVMKITNAVVPANPADAKVVADTIYADGLPMTLIKYGIPHNADPGPALVDIAFDARRTDCDDGLAPVFRFLCRAQGIDVENRFFKMQGNADRPMVANAAGGDDKLVEQARKPVLIHSGANGTCQSAAVAPNTQCITNGAVGVGANVPVISGGGYRPGGPHQPHETKWVGLLVEALGLNRAAAGEEMDGRLDQAWLDVKAGKYQENPASFLFKGADDNTDDVDKKTASRYFFGIGNGHALSFLKHGDDFYMYDPTFRPNNAVPAKNVYGKEYPQGFKRGDKNSDFRKKYYNEAAPLHMSEIVFDDGVAGALRTGKLASLNVPTVDIPDIKDFELILLWVNTP